MYEIQSMYVYVYILSIIIITYIFDGIQYKWLEISIYNIYDYMITDHNEENCSAEYSF